MYFIGAVDEELRIILIRPFGNRFAALNIFEIFPDGATVFRVDQINEKLPVQVIGLVQNGPAQ